jgi:hypothetical protein
MSLVVLQPCGNRGSRDHYRDTIENKVHLSTLQAHLSREDFDTLQAIYPSGGIAEEVF